MTRANLKFDTKLTDQANVKLKLVLSNKGNDFNYKLSPSKDCLLALDEERNCNMVEQLLLLIDILKDEVKYFSVSGTITYIDDNLEVIEEIVVSKNKIIEADEIVRCSKHRLNELYSYIIEIVGDDAKKEAMEKFKSVRW